MHDYVWKGGGCGEDELRVTFFSGKYLLLNIKWLNSQVLLLDSPRLNYVLAPILAKLCNLGQVT